MFLRLTHHSTLSTHTMGLAHDRPTLDRLVREHLPAALRFVTRLTGDLDAAEEVVQEALLRVARGWQNYRGESEFRTWLFRIVINAFRDRHTGRAAPEALSDDVCDSLADDPLSLAMASELGEIVARLVSGLPSRQREVLVLTSFEGLDTQAVAAVLGITEGNVRTNLHLARERLQSNVELDVVAVD